MKSLGFKPMTCLSYRNKTAQLHKVKLFSTCSWSQDTLPLISLKICNHHWKSMSSSTLLQQSTVCVEGPFMALVWCEIFGWCLTDSRCLTGNDMQRTSTIQNKHTHKCTQNFDLYQLTTSTLQSVRDNYLYEPHAQYSNLLPPCLSRHRQIILEL